MKLAINTSIWKKKEWFSTVGLVCGNLKSCLADYGDATARAYGMFFNQIQILLFKRCPTPGDFLWSLAPTLGRKFPPSNFFAMSELVSANRPSLVP